MSPNLLNYCVSGGLAHFDVYYVGSSSLLWIYLNFSSKCDAAISLSLEYTFDLKSKIMIWFGLGFVVANFYTGCLRLDSCLIFHFENSKSFLFFKGVKGLDWDLKYTIHVRLL